MSRNTRLIIIGLIAVGFILYAFNFNNALFWDDDDWIITNPVVHSLSWENTKFLFSHDILAGVGQRSNYFRPVLSLSFALNWVVGGESPFGYHLISNLLHIGSAVLLYLLFAAFLKSRAAGAIAALFWLIHPLNTEAVTYISGRGDPLSVFLMLTSLSVWLLARGHWPSSTGHSSWGVFESMRGRPLIWQSVAVLLAAFALLSRETAVLFPGYVVLFLMTFVYLERFRLSLVKSVKATWPFIVLSGSYVALRLTVLNFENTLNWHRFSNIYTDSIIIRIWTFLGALFDYGRLAFVPVGLHMERNVSVLTSPLIWPVPLVAGILALTVWQVVRSWRSGNRLWFFGVGWFFLALSIASGIAAPINALMYEHWMYLPLVGIAVLIGHYATQLYTWARAHTRPIATTLIILAVLYGGFLSIQTVRRNIIWGQTERFYLQILDYEPKNNRVLNNLANLYADEGQPEKAEEYWRKAVEADPTHPAPYHNLGNLARDRGEFEEAENLYLLAISKDETFHYAYRNLVGMFLEQKRFEEAQNLLVVLTQLVPSDPSIYFVLAQLYDAAGRTDTAEQILQVGIKYVRTEKQAVAYEQLLKKVRGE